MNAMRCGGTRAILIVDDEAPLRRRIRQIVSDDFAATDLFLGDASSGAECIAMLGERAWDAVVLDIRMPGTQGFDVLRAIKATHAFLPVVMLSGLPADQYEARALRAGALAYVQKERVREDLVPVLRALFDARSVAP